jgi:hypothetical protein
VGFSFGIAPENLTEPDFAIIGINIRASDRGTMPFKKQNSDLSILSVRQ